MTMTTASDRSAPTQAAKDRLRAGIRSAIRKNLKPSPKMNMVEWADEYRYLPDNSAEAGKWRTSRVEVAREPMLSVSDPDCMQITMMCCVQLMKTELINNAVGYFIHQEPSPIIVVNPKKEFAEMWSKERFSKMVRATPVLKELFNENRRGDGNTILQKQFAGGQISMVSARNPDDLASRACRIVCCDEIDKFVNTVEGDSIRIVWERSRTFGDRAKLIVACSPTNTGSSRIEAEYLASDQRVFLQPCSHCGHECELQWENVIIPEDEDGDLDPENATYACPECGAEWNEKDRRVSIAKGRWQATKPKVKKHHGYRCTSFASPFIGVVEMATKFVECGDDPNKLKVFHNTILARSFKLSGESVGWQDVYDRREDYEEGYIDDSIGMITCGIDVQKGYVVYEYVGFNENKETFSIAAGIVDADVNDDAGREKIKRQIFDRTFRTNQGIMFMPEKICIDAGAWTQAVYSLVNEYGSRRVVPVMGERNENLTMAIGVPKPVSIDWHGKRQASGVMRWDIGGAVIKTLIFANLQKRTPTDDEIEKAGYPSGYCHFPQYDEEFFKQLTAEELIVETDNNGYSRSKWSKKRKDNHFLDCRTYAIGGSYMLGAEIMNSSAWKERLLMLHPKPEDREVDKVTSREADAKIVADTKNKRLGRSRL